jgi:hypothetical protein
MGRVASSVVASLAFPIDSSEAAHTQERSLKIIVPSRGIPPLNDGVDHEDDSMVGCLGGSGNLCSDKCVRRHQMKA